MANVTKKEALAFAGQVMDDIDRDLAHLEKRGNIILDDLYIPDNGRVFTDAEKEELRGLLAQAKAIRERMADLSERAVDRRPTPIGDPLPKVRTRIKSVHEETITVVEFDSPKQPRIELKPNWFVPERLKQAVDEGLEFEDFMQFEGWVSPDYEEDEEDEY